MKNFKRFLITIMLFIITIFSYAVDKKTLNIHYKRFDNNYDKWNLWIWEEGKEGKTYFFTKDDNYGKIATIEVDGEKIGFLLKKGEWEDRDVLKDRFVRINSKNKDIYLVEENENIYTEEKKVDLRPKIKKSNFLNFNEIEFELKLPLKLEDQETNLENFKVIDDEKKQYKIEKIEFFEKNKILSGKVKLKDKIELGKKYFFIAKDHLQSEISLEQLFSSKEFEEKYFYNEDDLGVILGEKETKFRVWAPTAEKVVLNLYESGEGNSFIKACPMKKDIKGTWYLSLEENLENFYYTYSITVNGEEKEAVDIYAKAVGVNGNRGMIVDLTKTNPNDWEKIKKPEFKKANDAIIYEIHIRDLSIDKTSGIKFKGKFLGMIEKNSINNDAISTGLSHIKDLGVTHIQVLPSFDYASVNETKLDIPQFNWGYDPKNYNVPEGSYSTNPYDGRVRIKEYKEMVKELHQNGIRIIMDVVFNHTAQTTDSDFNKIVPDYYYRKENGKFSNASACGNETASERAMMRKFIIDSVVYWAKEYKVDGFRFDLMGIHDIETMNLIRKELDKIDPSIIIYGEPWAAGDSPLSENLRSVKSNTKQLNKIGVFNDDIRDGLKGSVFNSKDKGFATGANNMEEKIKFGIVGAISHNQVNYSIPWANSPAQSINYASAHDNLSLWDKIYLSNSDKNFETRKRMNNLCSSIIMTSQGVVFFQAGEEFLRSKPLGENQFDENSYKSNDDINSLKWNEKTKNLDVYNYYKGLIEFRKDNPGLRMKDAQLVEKNLRFIENLPKNVIAYTINSDKNIGQDKKILIIHNGQDKKISFNLPKGKWNIYINDKKSGKIPLEKVSGEIIIPEISTMVLKEEK